MGSDEEPERDEEEERLHEVEMAQACYLAAHEVAQKQFRAVVGSTPSYFSNEARSKSGVPASSEPGGGMDRVNGLNTEDFPVENVSWEEAEEFYRELNRAHARLPAGWV